MTSLQLKPVASENQKITQKATPFYYGGVASAMAACCTHPLDLIKVRLQTIETKGKTSLIKTVSDIIRNESIKGLFKGLSASIVRQLTYSTVRFGGYEEIKRRMISNGESFTMDKALLSGVLAGALGGIAGTPADVVNVRMQSDGKLPVNERRNYKNVFDGFYKISRAEGSLQLFRGVGPNVYRAMIMNASQVGSYDLSKIQLVEQFGFNPKDTKTHFLSSLFASLVATTASSPVDVIKTRMMNKKVVVSPELNMAGVGNIQIPQVNTVSSSNSTWSALVSILKNEGPIGLFKGWIPAFTRLGPQTILTFIFLEQMKELYLKFQK